MPTYAALIAYGFWTLYNFISKVVYAALVTTASIIGPIIWTFIGFAGAFLADLLGLLQMLLFKEEEYIWACLEHHGVCHTGIQFMHFNI